MKAGHDTDPLTEKVIGLAIQVHRTLGPGLLESVYEACLCREFQDHGLRYVQQAPGKVNYKGTILEGGFRMDILVEDSLVIEVKAVEQLLPVHQAQLLTYLKLSGKRRGLLMNFNTRTLKDGLKRLSL